MKNLEINVESKETYKTRMSNGLIFIIIFSCVLFVVGIYQDQLVYGIGLGLFFLIIQLYRSDLWSRFYILSLVITSHKVSLTYYDRDSKKSISDDAANFKFKKKIGFSKTRLVYMAVYYKNAVIIEQAVNGDWNEAKFDLVTDASQ